MTKLCKQIILNKNVFLCKCIEKYKQFEMFQLFRNLFLSICGILYFYYLHIRYGRRITIILMRGATGDIYLSQIFFKQYLSEENIKDYVFLSENIAAQTICSLFKTKNTIRIKKFFAVSLVILKKIKNNPTLHILFLWDKNLYFNKCRTRMLEKFTFLDSYLFYVFHLNTKLMEIPEFKAIESFRDVINDKNILYGKTIILSPEATSVYGLDWAFWNDLGITLEKQGFKVIVSVNPRNSEKYIFENLFFSYEISVPLLNYCGYFIGLRSGLCDIIESSTCKKIILYPPEHRIKNYSVHRSDKVFSGLSRMYSSKNTIEIESILIKNMNEPLMDLKCKYLEESLKNLIVRSL